MNEGLSFDPENGTERKSLQSVMPEISKPSFPIIFSERGVQYGIYDINGTYELVFPRLEGTAGFTDGTIVIGEDLVTGQEVDRQLRGDIHKAVEGSISDARAYAIANEIVDYLDAKENR